MGAWPSLPLETWVDTRETLHLWTQMVGKVKLARCPFLNQWWEVGLSLNARGLTSGLIPDGQRSFEIAFDFVEHKLVITVSDGPQRSLGLTPRTVADFYAAFSDALAELGIEVAINPMPSEIERPVPVPFDQDQDHAAYDGDAVARWWQAMLSVERAIQRFRVGFTGKSSPVLFYWGGFDLNHTRFNGRPAAQPLETNPMIRFGENEENFALGFWPGSREAPQPVLYAYLSPAPEGIEGVRLEPGQARWVPALGEFVLPYEAAAQSDDPNAIAAAFFTSAYQGAAQCAGWDLAALEGPVPGPPATE